MLRRTLLRVAFPAAAGVAFTALEPLYGDERVAWGTAVGSLKIGLRIEETKGSRDLAVLLRNKGVTPQELYLWDGNVPRNNFMARDSSGKTYNIESRLLYVPCAGLCGSTPTIKRLKSGSTEKVTLPLDDLLYVPSERPYATLTLLLQSGYSVQATFGMTEQDLKDGKLSPEFPWLGRVTSAELRGD